jgi:hypothetical protein
MTLLDWYSASYTIVICGFLTVLSLSYIYGRYHNYSLAELKANSKEILLDFEKSTW